MNPVEARINLVKEISTVKAWIKNLAVIQD
jgi:hypothetical protein